MKEIPFRQIRETVNEPSFSGSFSIRRVEQLMDGRDMVQELHRHNFYYILVLKQGTGIHNIDFVQYPITNNCVFFMRPGQVHDLLLKVGSTGYLLAFTHDFYVPSEKASSQVLRSVSEKNFCPLAGERFGNLLNMLQGMLVEYNDKQDRYLDVIRSSLNIFFVELLRRCADVETPPAGKQAYQQERLSELQQLITRHIAAQKQPAWYAKQLNLTSYQLNAITKASLGKTTSAVINDYILLEAKRYLLATSNQVNEIAWHLGFQDVSYFSRFFRKHTNYSPQDFRENFS